MTGVQRVENKSRHKKATLADIARECGLSISSVSLVLNEKPLAKQLSIKTRQKIQQAAKRLRYVPNKNAQALRKRRSNTVGVMVFDIADPFCTLILKGIQSTLDRTKMLPIILDARSQGKQFERYLSLLMEHRVEGLIVVANWLFADTDISAHLQAIGVPIVVVGRNLTSKHVSCILVDNEQGGFLAAQHLYDEGHREIAFIRGPRSLADSQLRWRGIERFTDSVGYPLKAQLAAEMPDVGDPLSGFDSGYDAIVSFLASGRKFSAVLAFDDLTAIGALRALQERDLKVPEQVSVIGFDDIPVAALMSPGLSTVRQPMSEMGAQAARQILQLIESGEEADAGRSVTLMEPRIVPRGSSVATGPRLAARSNVDAREG